MGKVYLDEVFKYQGYVRERRATDYLMQLSIARNAFSDDQALANQLRQLANIPDRDYLDAEIDKSGLEVLRQQLSGGVSKKV